MGTLIAIMITVVAGFATGAIVYANLWLNKKGREV